jgi:alpha-L-arabinofuranosidase
MRSSVTFLTDRAVGPVPPTLFGHLLARRTGVAEEGLHDPTHPSADAYGIRQDIEPLIRGLKPTVFRWPGGCTGASYHWLDGVGPVEERPRTIDVHFGTEVGYKFGTNEFIAWCRRMGAEPLVNWNMGTGTFDEALAWLEYCNRNGSTRWAKLRREHGVEQPHNVRYWQLGNETYGWWELGQTTAAQYGETAREWAKGARHIDPSIAIVALGGRLEEKLDWASTVIPLVAPYADYVTFHAFWKKSGPGDPWYRVLAGPHWAEWYARALTGLIAIAQREVERARPLSVAITEWNTSDFGVHMADTPTRSAYQPYYTLQDALANAGFLNMLLRESRSVKLTTSAQILNVRGHIMANDEGVWPETIYWPYHMLVNNLGDTVLDAWVDSEAFSVPEMQLHGMPYLDAAVTSDPGGRIACSLVNRHRDEPLTVRIASPGARFRSEARIALLHHSDPLAKNGPRDPGNVAPTVATQQVDETAPEIELPPHSYALLELQLA